MLRRIVMIVVALTSCSGVAAAHSNPPVPSPVATAPATPPSPSPSPDPSPPPTASPTPAPLGDPMQPKGAQPYPFPNDGAFSLPGGVWNCQTLADSNATNVYRLTDAHHIQERTMLYLPKRPPVELDTSLAFDATTALWHLTMQHGAYVATASAWTSPVWTFDGIESDGVRRRVRLVYTSLGPDAYRSDFQARSAAGWQTFSGATCRRAIP